MSVIDVQWGPGGDEALRHFGIAAVGRVMQRRLTSVWRFFCVSSEGRCRRRSTPEAAGRICRWPRRRRCAAAESPRRLWSPGRGPPASVASGRSLGRTTERPVATGHGSPRPRTAALVEERRVLAEAVPDDPELAVARCVPDVSSASVP